MKRTLLLFLVVVGSGCAALKQGWARVTWVEGKIAPAVSCSTRIGAEGDVEMVCLPLNDVDTNLLWKRERARVTKQEEI